MDEPMTLPPFGAFRQAVRIMRNNNSVPLSPAKNWPDPAFMNTAISALALLIVATSAWDAGLSRP